jgi:hypothetical protein
MKNPVTNAATSNRSRVGPVIQGVDWLRFSATHVALENRTPKPRNTAMATRTRSPSK